MLGVPCGKGGWICTTGEMWEWKEQWIDGGESQISLHMQFVYLDIDFRSMRLGVA